MEKSLITRSNNPHSECMKLLQKFLDKYPKLVSIEMAGDGKEKICFVLKEFKEAIAVDFPDLVLTSFERGMKHQGFFVSQSTHNKAATTKEWMLKCDAPKEKQIDNSEKTKKKRPVRKCVKPLKKRKVSCEDEDSYNADSWINCELADDNDIEKDDNLVDDCIDQVGNDNRKDIENWADDYLSRMGLNEYDDFVDLDVVPPLL